YLKEPYLRSEVWLLRPNRPEYLSIGTSASSSRGGLSLHDRAIDPAAACWIGGGTLIWDLHASPRDVRQPPPDEACPDSQPQARRASHGRFHPQWRSANARRRPGNAPVVGNPRRSRADGNEI